MAVYTPTFNPVEFYGIRSQAGAHLRFNSIIFGWRGQFMLDARVIADVAFQLGIRVAPQLLVLANMEGMNAEFIHMGLPQGERLKRLNQTTVRQMQFLTSSNLKALPGAKEK